ncbi:hypothetical protein [Kitasatospora sp. MBT66]|uniref:hypothetical protein n=1 Tax=Kitasatospora sp. MBT66 TaxID=1444769 RepID=UPI000A52EB92|nr:hypothetical protein [Kitasatospora sp. MBT66]
MDTCAMCGGTDLRPYTIVPPPPPKQKQIPETGVLCQRCRLYQPRSGKHHDPAPGPLDH